MFTHYYNGSYIQGYCGKNKCYVTDDSAFFYGKLFKSYRSAQIAITKARNQGLPVSR
jgi:hypothetical protein